MTCLATAPAAEFRTAEQGPARIEGTIGGQPRSREWRFEPMGNAR
jgi:hypothetical protein